MRISDWSSDVCSTDLARRRNADIYRSIIKPGHVFIPEEKAHEQVSYVMFIAQCDDRDRLQKYLADHGVQTLVYYGTALHLHKAAEKFGYKRGDFPEIGRAHV